MIVALGSGAKLLPVFPKADEPLDLEELQPVAAVPMNRQPY
jgi:hypothetical protein